MCAGSVAGYDNSLALAFNFNDFDFLFQSEHFIKDCPSKDSTEERKPSADYRCPGCGAVGEHFYKQCDNYKPRENLPPITQHECWFCLSNPNVE